MCLGRTPDACVCDDAPTPVAVCAGCGAATDDPSALGVTWGLGDEQAWCPACMEAIDAEEHEQPCHCPACLAAVEQFWQGEAERAMSMETTDEGAW